MTRPLVDRARELWTELAGVPIAFPAAVGIEVVVSPGSRLCPPGWAGIVALGGSGIATAPDDGVAAALRNALAKLPVDAVTDVDRLDTELAVVDVLGPATLAYLDEREFRPVAGAVEALAADHDDVSGLLASVPEEEADESGIAEISSLAYVIRNGSEIAAVAGYKRWPASVAHVCVLSAPQHRGRGLARAAASGAVTDALTNGLLPQWRARLVQSRRIAQALGFRELGAQLSVRIS